jgi:proline iminopeptidase
MNERALAGSVPGGALIGVRSGQGPAAARFARWAGRERLQRLAMQLAARAPGRVNALVLADPLGAVGDGGFAGFGAELEARATPEALARMAELDELSATSKQERDAAGLEYYRLDWPGYFAVPAQAPPVPDTVRVNAEAFEQTAASVAEAVELGDLPGLLRAFTGPVELLAGKCSPLPHQAAESTAAVFPDARLTIVPGAGHQVWHEAPGCMAAALSRVAARLV